MDGKAMMPIRQLREVMGEAGALALYAASSVVGRWVHPGHHREGRASPVVLVPGFLGRGLGFSRMKRALVRAGYPVYVADLGYGVGCIEEKAELLEAFVDKHKLEDFYIVAHSMGGLISMGMSRQARQRVRHFVTLGTAFHGALLSYLLPFLPAARQLNPSSSLLRRFIKRARRQDNLTAIVARWDEIALPPRSCRVEGCELRTGVAGHAQLIMRSASFKQLICLLDELEEDATDTASSRGG